jgi:hypothetical protein
VSDALPSCCSCENKCSLFTRRKKETKEKLSSFSQREKRENRLKVLGTNTQPAAEPGAFFIQLGLYDVFYLSKTGLKFIWSRLVISK